MRKWIALMLMVLMCASMMPAHAEQAAENVLDLSVMGLYAELPESWMALLKEGRMAVNPMQVYAEGYGLMADFYLLSENDEELSEDTDEETLQAWFDENVVLALRVAVLPDTVDAETAFPDATVEKVSAEGGYANYFVRFTQKDEMIAKVPYSTVIADDVNLKDIFTFSTPDADYIAGLMAQSEMGNRAFGEDGMFNGFAAIDLDSKEVTDAILKDAKLTMVNIWGTFCSPCIKEMPFLGEISAEYADKGLQIVGLLSDVVEDGSVNAEMSELAKTIVDRTGAKYLHLLPTDEVLGTIIQNTTAVPTTYFVDAEGNLVGDPLVGSRSKADWITVIDERLASLGE